MTKRDNLLGIRTATELERNSIQRIPDYTDYSLGRFYLCPLLPQDVEDALSAQGSAQNLRVAKRQTPNAGSQNSEALSVV